MIRGAAVALVLLVLAGCGDAGPSTTPVAGQAASGAPGAPGGSPAPGATRAPAQSDATGAGGRIDDPTAGLDGLQAYRATLTYAFAGTQADRPSEWSQAFTLGVSRPAQARVLEHSATGLGDGPSAYLALEAVVGDAHLVRSAAGEPCAGETVTAVDQRPALLEPASLLPRVRAMTRNGTTDVAGVAATTYAFRALDVSEAPSVAGSGTTTVAGSGLVLALDLALTAGEDVFGAGTSGTMTWAYRLEPLDAGIAAVLPADCPGPLPDVPVVDGAQHVQRYPGYLAYETASTVGAVARFYVERMPAAGFAPIGDQWEGALGATSAWSRDGLDLGVSIVAGTPVTVTITRRAPVDEPVPSPPPQPTTAAQAGTVRVARAYSLLTGTDTTPSALGSYHLAYEGTSSSWRDKVVTTTTSAIGDVAGDDLHFVVKETARGKTERTEGYTVGRKAYLVTGGKVATDDGFGKLAWISWPLNAAMAMGIGSLRASEATAATVAGRTAEAYRITGTIADDPSGSFASFGLPITSATGTVWVDTATGALLGADVTYTADLKDGDGKVRATRKDKFTIEVTRIGATSVALP